MKAERILVVGELNVDLIVGGLAAFPALGQEILADHLRLALGGSSAICAAGLARLRVQVDLLGKVGVDYDGDFVVDELRRLDVGTETIIRDRMVRTGLTISLTYPQGRALITYLGCISLLAPEDIELSLLRRYGHLHVGSYFLQSGLQAGLPELFRRAHQRGLTVSLDPGYDPDELWGGHDLLALLEQVDLFLPNEEEAWAIAGVDDTGQALRVLARRAGQVVVKCGAAGAISLDGDRIVPSPAFALDVVDTTGAGDSFDAGFLYAYVLRCLPLEEALRFANACGALSTTGFGGTTAQPTLEEVWTFLKERGT